MKKLSRRRIFAVASVATVAAVAQEAPPAPAKTTMEEDLASARNALRNSSAALSKVQVPIATEPAFQFKS